MQGANAGESPHPRANPSVTAILRHFSGFHIDLRRHLPLSREASPKSRFGLFSVVSFSPKKKTKKF